jgi:hypothetical protein
MAIIAEFVLQPTASPFEEVFVNWPETRIEIDRIQSDEYLLYVYFWVTAPDSGPTEADMQEYERLNAVRLLDEQGDEKLFVAQVDRQRESVLVGIEQTVLNVESAVATSTEWLLRLRAALPDQLSRFQQLCREDKIPAKLTQFPSELQVHASSEYNLTEKQRSVLVQAYAAGYFEEPRQTTLEELAVPLNITPQAVLARLRKGQQNLIESTIVQSI